MKHLLPFLFLMACSNPYDEAKQANTIEAYEKYLEEHGSSARAMEATMALENLYIEKARASKDPADYDTYLNRFVGKTATPSMYTKVAEERKEVAWDRAIELNTAEAYQAFIDKYNLEDPRKSRIAKSRLRVAKYQDNLVLAPIEKEKANLGQDDEGALNGWKFSTEITNKGDKEIWYLRLRVSFLDAEGKVAGAESETVIGMLKGREWATPDNQKPPFKGGETRSYEHLTGDTPPEWGGQVRMDFIDVLFTKPE